MRNLPIIATILLLATSTFAGSPDETPAPATPEARSAEQLVQTTLLQPLAKKDDQRSRFSRSLQPPSARRLRILDGEPSVDARGFAFVRFEVDARHGRRTDAAWQLGAITGCAYLAKGEVFVWKGDEVRPAKFLLGKYAKAADGETCKAVTLSQNQAAPGA